MNIILYVEFQYGEIFNIRAGNTSGIIELGTDEVIRIILKNEKVEFMSVM